MRYALLLYVDPVRAAATTAAEAERELSAYAAISEELARAGVLRGGEAFLPAATARFVQAAGEAQVDAAVSVAGKGWELSGFYIVACDQQQALDIAARMPVVEHGVVEVRPLMDLPEPGESRADAAS